MAFAKERDARARSPSSRSSGVARSRSPGRRRSGRSHLGPKLDEKGKKSVEAMAQAIVNKLLHGPTARLKAGRVDGRRRLPGAAAELVRHR